VGKDIWFYALGFTAQAFFSARMLIQWFLSERAKKVISPTIYWQLSLIGAFLLSIYGWLREDFAIILGQFFSYYIYIWNLDNKNHWKNIHVLFRYIIMFTPIVALLYVSINNQENIQRLFGAMPIGLLLFGSAGQIIFTFRFVFQWWYSRSRQESLLPATFWILSLLGSSIIVIYGIFRKDPVLMLGQSVGFIAYIRNLYFATRKTTV